MDYGKEYQTSSTQEKSVEIFLEKKIHIIDCCSNNWAGGRQLFDHVLVKNKHEPSLYMHPPLMHYGFSMYRSFVCTSHP